MDIKRFISKRSNTVSPSATLAITAKAKQMIVDGKDVVNMAAGEPDFDTPTFIIDSAIEALQNGKTRYTPASGIRELKDVIAQKLQTENELNYKSENIVVSIGAKHSLYNIMQIILDPDDEVIIPTPYWVSYKEMVSLASGVPVFVETNQDDNYYLHTNKLNAALTSKTKAIIINSPNNPTGATYSKANLEEIANFALKNEILIISDEIYEKILYAKENYTSIGSLSPEIFAQTITVNGLSKTYSMTGWRIGYVAAPMEITSAISKLQSHSTSNPTTFVQYGALTALKDSSTLINKNMEIFKNRRDLIFNGLSDISGISLHKPTGAFYIFPDVSSFYGKEIEGKELKNSFDFCELLLEKELVAAVPGNAFGNDNHIRLSYATSDEMIEEAVKRIKSFINRIG